MTIESWPDAIATEIDALGLISHGQISPNDHADTIEQWYDGCLCSDEAAQQIIYRELLAR